MFTFLLEDNKKRYPLSVASQVSWVAMKATVGGGFRVFACRPRLTCPNTREFFPPFFDQGLFWKSRVRLINKKGSSQPDPAEWASTPWELPQNTSNHRSASNLQIRGKWIFWTHSLSKQSELFVQLARLLTPRSWGMSPAICDRSGGMGW